MFDVRSHDLCWKIIRGNTMTSDAGVACKRNNASNGSKAMKYGFTTERKNKTTPYGDRTTMSDGQNTKKKNRQREKISGGKKMKVEKNRSEVIMAKAGDVAFEKCKVLSR